MWLTVTYLPTSLFSLRPANATSSGGKTLLTPTPFAFKMALLDVAIRVYGKEQARSWFPTIRDLDIWIRLPQHVMVINTFVKILRPHKNGAKDTSGTGLIGPMGNTIAYREMVQFSGAINLALRSKHDAGVPLAHLCSHIHYLGKRGGFMQFRGTDQTDADRLNGFTCATSSESTAFSVHGLMQLLDNCGAEMTFAQADIYSGRPIRLGSPSGRVLNSVVFPYRLARSSRSYSLYERIDS